MDVDVYVLWADIYYSDMLGVFRNIDDAKQVGEAYVIRHKFGLATRWEEREWGLQGIPDTGEYEPDMYLNIQKMTIQ